MWPQWKVGERESVIPLVHLQSPEVRLKVTQGLGMCTSKQSGHGVVPAITDP